MPVRTPLDLAQRKLKTFQWDKVSPHGLAATIWARPNGAPKGDAAAVAERLREQGIFDAMEEDFRAKQTVKLAAKRDKTTLMSCLESRHAQNIGQSSFPAGIPCAPGLPFACIQKSPS